MTAKATLQILQINDVYEAAPGNPQTPGGLARIGTLKDRAPGAILVIAGDFLSPSVFNGATVDGVPVAGRHMIEVANLLGVDIATLGNHEFDLDEHELLARIKESKFTWVNSNIHDQAGLLISGTVPYVVREITDTEGRTMRVGLFSVSVGHSKSWIRVLDPIETARKMVAVLRSQADAVVAVTHLYSDGDRKLAREVPGIDLIMGGHEHEGVFFTEAGVNIAKARSNARTMFDHRIELVRAADGQISRKVTSTSVPVLPSLPLRKDIAERLEWWHENSMKYFISEGFRPERVLCHTHEELDGLDMHVRLKPTNLGSILAAAMATGVPGADLALVSGGVLRIDDVIPPGPVTEYDVLRIVPKADRIVGARLPGSLISRLLKRELAFTKLSTFQTWGVTRTGDELFIQDQPLDESRSYLTAVTDHLYKRIQTEVLGTPQLTDDIRKLLTRYFESFAVGGYKSNA